MKNPITKMLFGGLALVAVVFCVPVDAQPSEGKNTTELKAELTGKTKTEVKEYFGRAPDAVMGDSWNYRGSYFDPDAETTLTGCVINFYDGAAKHVVFMP